MMGAISRLKVTGELSVADFDVEGTGDFAKRVPMAPVVAMRASDQARLRGQEFIPGLRCSIPLP